MSVNVSLVESDTPGVSLYFDGQPVQDLQEAELRREEERQAKELQHLLETELEDFEDDFLSGSNSEDEDRESFDDISTQQAKNTRQHKFEPGPGLTSLSPAGSTQVQPHTSSIHIQPLSVIKNVHPHIGLNKSDPQSQFPYMRTSNPSQEYEQFNLLHTQTRDPHTGEKNNKNVLDSHGHGASIAQEDCNLSDLYLSLPSAQQKPENVPTGENQSWSNEYSSLPGNISSTISGQVFHHMSSQDSRHTFLPIQSGDHYVPGLARNGLPGKRNVADPNLDDEWMMQIKKPTVGAYSDPKGHQYSHNQYQQQPHWHSADYTNGFLQNGPSSLIPIKHTTTPHPETSTTVHPGVLPNPEETKQNVLLQSQPAHQGTSTPSLPTLQSSTSIPLPRPAGSNNDGQQTWRNQLPQLLDAGDGQLKQYKVQYQKPGLDAVGEEEFYLDNEQVDFFCKDRPEDRRSYEQLEILYRARGREIEEVTRRMEEKEEERGKEIRSLKHKLFMATGESEARDETLRQCQKLLQEAKTENTEATGKIRALESQVSSLKNVKEELIKKLQAAESAIENMTHHIEELQDSESLSRARNEHEGIISSLTSRHQQELLAMKEKLDVSKTELEVKQEELNHFKTRLADVTQELETTQISRGNMINKLSRSLEESQNHCQMLLEQSSSHEMSLLKVQLQQALASKRISEDLCNTFQSEVKELKEQLNMLESASNLGVFAVPSHTPSAASHDDSMADLGIKKTLIFDSPQSVPRSNGTRSSDELITSLRSELEKCLASNKQKRSEVTEKTEEIKTLRATLEEAQNKVVTLEKTCMEQKTRLQEMGLLTSSGLGLVEARLQRNIEDLKREKEILLVDIEEYKKRLQEVGDSEAKLTEINAELSQQIAQMVNDYDTDKRAALESCQRTMEEVSRMSIDKLRQEMEERFESEKSMLSEHYKQKVDHLKRELISAQVDLDNVKSLYIKTCEESAAQEAELTDKFKRQLEEELGKMKDRLEAEKRDWESFMRDQMAEEQEGFKKSVREVVEAEWKVEADKDKQLMVEQAKLACLEEQKVVRQTMLDEARKQWQEQHDRDLRLLTEEREGNQLELARLQQKISDLELKLCSESVGVMVSQDDVRMEFEAKLKSLEKNHKEEMNELMMRLDRERLL